MKLCKGCQNNLPDNKFSITDKKKGTLRSLCIKCSNEKDIERYHRERKEESRNKHLKRNFGITLEEYDALLEKQDNHCEICPRTPEENGRRLCVDHDHKTGKVRGLLCTPCNTLLGQANDNEDILLKAIQYLNKYKENK